MTDSKELQLTPPEPVAAVEKEKAAGLVPLSAEQQAVLDAKAEAFIEELLALDENSPDFGKKSEQLSRMGRQEISDASDHSKRFLSRPMRAMDKDSSVGAELVKLRRTIEDLDPKSRGNLLEPKKIFGVIPFGNKLRSYFDEYKSAQSHISTIWERLDSGKVELLQVIAAVDVGRRALWDSMGELEEMSPVGRALDRKIEERALSLDASQADKARALREGPLFSMRQRVTDLLT